MNMEMWNKFGYGIWLFLFFFTAISCICDLRTGKIPNRILMTGAILGFAFQIFLACYQSDVWYILKCLLRVISFFILLWLTYQVGALGAGDCKLCLLIGLFLPIKNSVFILICAMVFAVISGIAQNVIRRTCLKKEALKGIHFSLYIMGALVTSVIFNEIL